MRSICQLEQHLLSNEPSYNAVCERYMTSQPCCRTWSLYNYVLLLNNVNITDGSCDQVTANHIRIVTQLLSTCSPYYHNTKLVSDCANSVDSDINHCAEVPLECRSHSAVYNILHYLTDSQYMTDNTQLNLAMTMIPVATGKGSEELYKIISSKSLLKDQVEIIAMNFGIKQQLFDDYMLRDMVWFTISLLVVYFCVWLYTSSVFLTLMGILTLCLTSIISYFIYTTIFNISFFPFINLLAILILIAIGTDDLFIYVREWRLAKLEKNSGMFEKVVSDTLHRATLSMFVTSLTTSAALYANYVSSITAIKCFALFSGTAVMVNFTLMITWIPALIISHDKWCNDCFLCPSMYSAENGFGHYVCRAPITVYKSICDFTRVLFDKVLPCLVLRLRYMWLVLFTGVMVTSMIIVLYKPRLRLPSSNEFQVFSRSHVFEVYDFDVKDKFWFEKSFGAGRITMPLTVVWGVKPTDTGDTMNPLSAGELEYDPTFNITAPQSQKWLLDFCRNLRRTKYYKPSSGPQLTNCFIEHFRQFMLRGCEGIDGEQYAPCCRSSTFPYQEDVFRKCLRVYRPHLSHTRRLYYSNENAGPRYSTIADEMSALVVEFNSHQSFSFSYTEMSRFYDEVNLWVKDQLRTAPDEMKGGWFISYLQFYDLQHSISHDTPITIAVSICLAGLVAFCTTLNVLISIYAIITITGAIFTTVASLVLLGWELNVVESVTISVAIGLSIDFTLHYGMSYRLAPDLHRQMRVVSALCRVGNPVTMAAVTSFLAGIFLLASTVLAYQQLGVFLILVMLISWFFSTFYFNSLLAILGPSASFGQFYWPISDCCSFRSTNNKSHVDKTIYNTSDSTITVSTSLAHISNQEMCELEPLNEGDTGLAVRRGAKPIYNSPVYTNNSTPCSYPSFTNSPVRKSCLKNTTTISVPSSPHSILKSQNHSEIQRTMRSYSDTEASAQRLIDSVTRNSDSESEREVSEVCDNNNVISVSDALAQKDLIPLISLEQANKSTSDLRHGDVISVCSSTGSVKQNSMHGDPPNRQTPPDIATYLNEKQLIFKPDSITTDIWIKQPDNKVIF